MFTTILSNENKKNKLGKRKIFISSFKRSLPVIAHAQSVSAVFCTGFPLINCILEGAGCSLVQVSFI